MNETWLPIPGWPSYEASSLGRIRRRGANTSEPRKPYAGKWGHLWLCMRDGGRRRCVSVHRLVALAFHGLPPSPRHEAAHNDGDATNNRPENVRWATRSENERDKVRHGRSNRGERQHMARLTAERVVEIRSLLCSGASQSEIAARFSVARTTVQSIANGRSWAWLSVSGVEHLRGRAA